MLAPSTLQVALDAGAKASDVRMQCGQNKCSVVLKSFGVLGSNRSLPLQAVGWGSGHVPWPLGDSDSSAKP